MNVAAFLIFQLNVDYHALDRKERKGFVKSKHQTNSDPCTFLTSVKEIATAGL